MANKANKNICKFSRQPSKTLHISIFGKVTAVVNSRSNRNRKLGSQFRSKPGPTWKLEC